MHDFFPSFATHQQGEEKLQNLAVSSLTRAAKNCLRDLLMGGHPKQNWMTIFSQPIMQSEKEEESEKRIRINLNKYLCRLVELMKIGFLRLKLVWTTKCLDFNVSCNPWYYKYKIKNQQTNNIMSGRSLKAQHLIDYLCLRESPLLLVALWSLRGDWWWNSQR